MMSGKSMCHNRSVDVRAAGIQAFRKRRHSMVLGLLLMLGFVTSANAQVTTRRPLAFGTVWPGIPKEVSVTSANAAYWTYSTLITLTRKITFILPTHLSDPVSGATMPIEFCSTCGRYRFNSPDPSNATEFDPVVGTQGLSISLVSTLHVWLGGRVIPNPSQPKGNYSATITIELMII